MAILNAWARRAKKLVAYAITSYPVSTWIRLRFRDRIPSKCGLLDVSTAKIPNRTKALIYWNMYESAERRFVEKYLHSDLDTIELGSSLGGISSAIAKRLSRGNKLVCVEANPGLMECLRTNLKNNAPHLNLQIVNAAIGYRGKSVLFHSSDDNLVSRSLVSSISDRSSEVIEVPCVKLCELVSAEGEKQFQLVCDIEGMEWEVASEDSQALEACALAIVEAHDFEGKKYFEFFTCLTNQGFKMIDKYDAVAVFSR